MTLENREPIEGFDVLNMVARLPGWEMREPAQGQNYWLFHKDLQGEQAVNLSVDTNKKQVLMRETTHGSLETYIACDNVYRVDFFSDRMIFWGDIQYEVSSNGGSHDVKDKWSDKRLFSRDIRPIHYETIRRATEGR